MKNKILGVVTLLGMLGSSALSAETIKNYHIGVAAVDTYDTSGTIVSIGYGVDRVLSNNIMFGVSLDFQGGTVDVEDSSDNFIYGIGADLRVGYKPLESLQVFVIGSALNQSVANISGAGFGYGAGAEYLISSHFSLAAEYKTYGMINKFYEYDYSSTGVNIKYLW